MGSGGAPGDSQSLVFPECHSWRFLHTPHPVSRTFPVRLPVCLLPRSLSRFLAPGLWWTPGQCPGTPPTSMSPNWLRIFLQSTSSSCLGGSMPPFQAVLSLRAPSISCLQPRPVGMGSGLLAGVCAAPGKALQPLPHSSSAHDPQDRPLLPSSPTVNPSEAFHQPRR